MSLKEIIFSCVTLLLSLAGLWLWQAEGGALWGAVLVFLAIILYGFTALYSESQKALGIAAVIPVLAGFYFLPRAAGYGVTLVVAALLVLWSLREITHERDRSPAFSIWKTLRAGMPLLFTGISLVIAAFAYQHETGASPRLIPKPVFDIIAPRALQLAAEPLGLEGIDLNSAVDDAIVAQFSRNTETRAAINSMSAAERKNFIREARTELAKRFGLDLRGDELVRDVLYDSVNSKANEIFSGYREYIPLIAAAGIFFAVRALAIPLYALAILVCYVLTMAAKGAGLLQIKTSTVELTRYSF